MATDNVNQWFLSASLPITAIAHMLMELDTKGLVPDEMRKAIHQHANNALDTIPGCIGAISQAMASALVGDVGLNGKDAADAAWGISALSDKLAAMNELACQFGSLYTSDRTH